MPRIPVGNKYSSTITGSTLKPVTCEYCGCQFLYQLKRAGKGEAESFLWLNNRGAENRARVSATNHLNDRLQSDIDAISCPDCGMYQENMVKKLKDEAWSEVSRVALSFGIIGAILVWIGACLLSATPSWLQLLLLSIVIGFWCWAVLRMALRAYNLKPNANAKNRRGRTFSEKYPVQRLDDFNDLKKEFIRELYFK